MPRNPSFTFVQLRDWLSDATDRKTIAAVLVIAMEQWKHKKINDYMFSSLLDEASESVLKLK